MDQPLPLDIFFSIFLIGWFLKQVDRHHIQTIIWRAVYITLIYWVVISLLIILVYIFAILLLLLVLSSQNTLGDRVQLLFFTEEFTVFELFFGRCHVIHQNYFLVLNIFRGGLVHVIIILVFLVNFSREQFFFLLFGERSLISIPGWILGDFTHRSLILIIYLRFQVFNGNRIGNFGLNTRFFHF